MADVFTVFTVLAADHAEVKAMMAELEGGPCQATGAGQHELDLRKRMTQTLVIEVSRHEALEEMFFWPMVRERHPDGNALADEAVAQEQQAKDLLAELDDLEPGNTRFDALLETFTQLARGHIDFEESQVWPGLHDVLPPEAAQELGQKITDGKRTAPTRPRPPVSPAAHG